MIKEFHQLHYIQLLLLNAFVCKKKYCINMYSYNHIIENYVQDWTKTYCYIAVYEFQLLVSYFQLCMHV